MAATLRAPDTLVPRSLIARRGESLQTQGLPHASPPFITLCMSKAPGQQPAGPAPTLVVPALVVRGGGEAGAALRLAAGRPVLLLSAPGAAGFLGARGWRALVEAAAAQAPGAPFQDAICCAAAPGWALAALRAGCRLLVLDAGCPAFPAVAGAAAEVGARLLPARPPALDLGTLDLGRPHGQGVLAAWLAASPHDSAPATS
jgi:hypothetical protein